jgi:hypothetical protein
MQFVPTDSNNAAQMKTLIEQSHGLSLRALIRFLFTHKDFNLLG